MNTITSRITITKQRKARTVRLSHLGKLVLRGWEWLSTPDERFVLQSPHGARYDFRLGAGGALLMPRVERVKDE